MKCKTGFDVQRILRAIRDLELGDVNIMEICGTHTMAIAKSGIKRMLPENIKLLSGPGCPVCVTPAEMIDAVLLLSEKENLILATYGDMLRVPGSRAGDNLARRRALGARVEIVYSPMDALEIAESARGAEVVFLGVGFETTAPGTAAAVQAAAERGIKNFSVLPMLKTVEPALRTLIADPYFNVDAFLCPGHVATIIGEAGFRFLAEEFGIPAVISGFEPEDILLSVYMLLRQIKEGRAKVENSYKRAVKPEGNPLARAVTEAVFAPATENWRGLGTIPASGLKLRDTFQEYDAAAKFAVAYQQAEKKTACRCGDVICGKLAPEACPLFGTACVPEEPVGPCMVSSEGACAAAYKYREC